MGEHLNNENAINKANEVKEAENKEESKGTVDPINVDSLLVITELAQIGFAHLTMLMPDMRETVAKGGSALTEDNLKHFESLIKVAPETIAHFNGICQYLFDAAKEIADKNEELNGQTNGEVKKE